MLAAATVALVPSPANVDRLSLCFLGCEMTPRTRARKSGSLACADLARVGLCWSVMIQKVEGLRV